MPESAQQPGNFRVRGVPAHWLLLHMMVVPDFVWVGVSDTSRLASSGRLPSFRIKFLLGQSCDAFDTV